MRMTAAVVRAGFRGGNCASLECERGLGTVTSVNVECLILSPTQTNVCGDYVVIVLHIFVCK